MRVLVLGAGGLIGGAVTARLLGDGCEVVGAGRDIGPTRRRLPQVDWRKADIGALDEAAASALLAGVDAVVDCAGALQDGPHDDLEAVHVRGLETLAKACVALSVRRFVLISA